MQTYFTIGAPTKSQENALQVLGNFLASSDKCMLLKGSAGTGKTSLLKACIDYLVSKNIPFVLMAPTGRAAKIISDKTGKQAYTIHKVIYSFKDLHFDEREEGYFEFYYRLQEGNDEPDIVYIIDESSMVSDVYSEDSFLKFGSGRLLCDIVSYANLSVYPKRKVIFVGDEIQLPPIKSDCSPALNVGYLKQNYGIDASECELTEVVRHTRDSGILANAEALREAIKKSCFGNIFADIKYPDIITVTREGLLQQYLKENNNVLSEKTIIIAYANYAAQMYNRIVRNHFFTDNKSITEGDRIIVINNNYAYEIELLNGDFGIVLEASGIVEQKDVRFRKRNGEIERIALFFRDVLIRFKDVKGDNHDIKCKILENCLNSNKGGVSCDERRALLVEFTSRNKSLKKGKQEFLDAIRKDPYFNCLQVKYGYAITCHKAQGGEWDNAFVDFRRPAKCDRDINYYRWAYTALTRAKNRLIILK